MLATIDLHVHESCMHVAVRVLHSCAFISSGSRLEICTRWFLFCVLKLIIKYYNNITGMLIMHCIKNYEKWGSHSYDTNSETVPSHNILCTFESPLISEDVI